MLRAHNSFKTNFWSIIYSFIFAKVDANLENPFFYADLFDTFVSIESSFWEQVWQVFIRVFFQCKTISKILFCLKLVFPAWKRGNNCWFRDSFPHLDYSLARRCSEYIKWASSSSSSYTGGSNRGVTFNPSIKLKLKQLSFFQAALLVVLGWVWPIPQKTDSARLKLSA